MVKLKPLLLGMTVVALVFSTLLFVNHTRANQTHAPASTTLSVNQCDSPDCIIYDISTQSQCREVGPLPASYDGRWGESGLSLNTDQSILGGEIVAFKLRWFNGTWSDWFVTGVNDIGPKYNTSNGQLIRWWAYFYDHEHIYILCTN